MQKAYGRLDVFWPDGKFETFSLVERTVSVGRSSGNTVALDTDSISRYHFSLAHDGRQITIVDMDSANGTYVDGVKLATGQPLALGGGEEIQIGELRLIYTDLDDSPTRPMVVPEETTQRIELEAPAFRIDVKGPYQAVAPGAHISAELAIMNTGKDTDRYVVEVNGPPRDWVRIDRPQIEVAPGKTESVVISFKPARRFDSTPGDYPVLLSVRPNRESVIMLTAELTLTVLSFGGFGMALESHQVGPDGRFRLHLHNQGNAPLPLAISVREPTEQLRGIVNASRITLAPGQRFVVQGTVRPKRNALFGEAQELPFDVLVRSDDAARFVAVQRAYATVRPSLPRWTPVAALGLLALIVGLALIAILWLTNQAVPPTPPLINSFTVSSTRVAQGEPLIVSWSARNADSLNISVNGTPVFTEDGEIGSASATINTSALEGEIVVAVSALNEGLEATSSQLVQVVRPMRVDLFTVDPPELVRNVVQTLAVEWNVPGAARTRLTGLEGFSTARIEPWYGSSGALANIAGIPQGPLQLTLYAEDASGNAIEQSIEVEVAEPFCASLANAVTLRASPTTDAQVVGTVPASTTVVVDAQDESGQWLRVLLTGGTPGWGPRAEFRCADNFEVGNLRQVLIIMTPVPTTEGTAEASSDGGATSTPEPLVTATPRPTPTTPPPTVTPRPTTRPTSTPRPLATPINTPIAGT